MPVQYAKFMGRIAHGNLGDSLTNIGEGMTDLMLAARPLTRWLANTIEGWTEWFKKSMAAGRATGELEVKFLDCAEGLLAPAAARAVCELAWSLEQVPDVAALWPNLDWMQDAVAGLR